LPASPPAGFSGENFYIVMNTDATDKVFESLENNNFGALPLTYDNDKIRITGASSQDVDLQGWWLDAPSQAQWGEQIVLNLAQVRNVGSSPSGTFDVEFYLSKDGHGSNDDVLLSRADGSGARYPHSSIPGKGTGATFYPKLKLPDSPPSGFSGEDFYIVMKSDATAKVVETNEANNFGNLALTFDNDKIRITGGSSGQADLSGWWTTVTDSAKWGETITVERAQVRNTGSGASGAFQLQWYLSRDHYGSSDDILLSRAGGGTSYVHGGVPANGYGSLFNTTLVLPTSLPAGWNGEQFYVVMKTDSAGHVNETNESNNFGQVGQTFDYDEITIKAAAGGYYKPIPSFPATGGYRGFGYWTGSSYHNGADYAASVGTVVSAVADGEVVISGEHDGFGSLNPNTKGGVIVVKHTDKFGKPFYAVYGHLTRSVSVGAKVTKGQTIGTIATFYNDGSFLPHLHLGIFTGSTFPNGGWGYSSSLTGWSEPKAFLENNL
jgi:murein DD-endopeptidase MepM/ murein hydrolase activator NlpD